MKKRFSRMLAVLLCMTMILTVTDTTVFAQDGSPADEAEEHFEIISISPESPYTPEQGQDTTVTIEFKIVNQSTYQTYVTVSLVKPSDPMGGAFSGTTVRKNNGSEGSVTLSDVKPGEYQLKIYAKNSNNENFYYNEDCTEHLYKITKWEQPDMTIEGMPETITYGDKIPGDTVRVLHDADATRRISSGDITSTNPEVATVDGNFSSTVWEGIASLYGITIHAPGTFYIQAVRQGDDSYEPKTMQFGPYTVAPKELTLDITVNDKQYDGLTDADFEAELVGVINNDDVTLVYDNVQADFASAAVGTDIPVTFTGEFSLTGEDADKYTLTQPSGVTASIFNDYTAVKDTDYTVNSNDWLNTDFVVSAADGYSVSLTDTADGEWADTLTATDETADGSFTFYVKNNATGAISAAASEGYKIDKTAPTGTLTLDGESSTAFSDSVTFDRFFNETQTITLNGDDTLSGVAKTEYFISDKALTLAEVQALTDWTEGSSIEIAAEDGKQFVCYARVTDNAGNASYLSTNGAAFDLTDPVVTGIANDGEYCIFAEFTVDDANLEKVQIDGADVTAVDGKYTLEPGTHTVSVTDKSGNVTTVSVTVYEDHQPAESWNTNEDSHWNECTVCGEKLNEAAHTFEWVTDKEATAAEAGSKHEECTVCGYEKAAVEIPATGTTEEPSEPSKPGGTPSEPPADTGKPSGDQTGDTTSPVTGDDSNIALWIAVLLAAGAALTGTAVYSRKRKYSR